MAWGGSIRTPWITPARLKPTGVDRAATMDRPTGGGLSRRRGSSHAESGLSRRRGLIHELWIEPRPWINPYQGGGLIHALACWWIKPLWINPRVVD